MWSTEHNSKSSAYQSRLFLRKKKTRIFKRRGKKACVRRRHIEHLVKLLLIYVQRLNTNKEVFHRISLMNSVYYMVKVPYFYCYSISRKITVQWLSSLEFNGE